MPEALLARVEQSVRQAVSQRERCLCRVQQFPQPGVIASQELRASLKMRVYHRALTFVVGMTDAVAPSSPTRTHRTGRRNLPRRLGSNQADLLNPFRLLCSEVRQFIERVQIGPCRRRDDVGIGAMA